MVKEHQVKQGARKEQQGEPQSDEEEYFTDSLNSLSRTKTEGSNRIRQWADPGTGGPSECWVRVSSYTRARSWHPFPSRVAQAYLNQKKLDAEAKQLQSAVIGFSKQTQQWMTLIDGFSAALKELGDIENWARAIENDMKSVTGILEVAYKTTRPIQPPTGS